MLLVEDKQSLAEMLREAFAAEGFEVDWSGSGSEAVEKIEKGARFTVMITDLRLPGKDGLAVLRAMRESDPECPVIVTTGFGTIETAVEAMRLGAFDFIQKPIDVDHLILLVRRCSELRALRTENLILREEYRREKGIPEIVGDSAEIVAVSKQIQKVAPTDTTVMLLGESGTGKELFARALHQISPRKNRPFVAINCAAIPESLLENELFGHEKGAYTGAGGRKLGKFELADGGTIFLDEIGDLGLSVQSKFLRVLQERRFERVGGTASVDVDVRIVCATNRNLHELVNAGTFRQDLFFRIHVFPVEIPPLRERRSDIDGLVAHFVDRFTREMGKDSIRITDRAMAALRSHSWPGNVRELENCIERAIILSDRGVVDLESLAISASTVDPLAVLRGSCDLSGTLQEAVDRIVSCVERVKIVEALEGTDTRQAAADRLGISYRTLLNRIRDLAIEVGDEGERL